MLDTLRNNNAFQIAIYCVTHANLLNTRQRQCNNKKYSIPLLVPYTNPYSQFQSNPLIYYSLRQKVIIKTGKPVG